MYDYLIKEATIVDGTGSAPYEGNVAVQDGLVAAVGDVDGPAKETVEAGGRDDRATDQSTEAG